MAASVLRLVLILSTLCSAAYIDKSLIDKAALEEWIDLEDEDQSTLKVVRADQVTSKSKLSYKEAEEYCEQDSAHLTSVRSQDEENFISELVLDLHRRDGGASDSSVMIPTGYSGEWSDRSSSDYMLTKKGLTKKCIYMNPEGITKAFKANMQLAECDDLTVN
ncbi:lectin C-type domain protein, partial [Cooperia oncophora]